MNAIKTTRISEDLTWKSLKDSFFIGEVRANGNVVHVNQLLDAITDGTLQAMVEKCATEMHEGNISDVVEAVKRNLSSYKTNMKKKDYAPTANVDKVRVELLWNFFDSLSVKEKKVDESLPESARTKSKWQLTLEEIEQLDKTNYKVLDSVYQNMMSMKSKYPDVVAATEGFMDRLAVVSKYRSAAKAAAKAEANTIDVPADLLARVQDGKSLTTEDKAKLAEILMQIKR